MTDFYQVYLNLKELNELSFPNVDQIIASQNFRTLFDNFGHSLEGFEFEWLILLSFLHLGRYID